MSLYTHDMAAGVVVHADWSTRPGKRWIARAVRRPDGRFLARAPEPVGEAHTLLARAAAWASAGGAALVGFDFPIGLPAFYAAAAGIEHFPDALRTFGTGEWTAFYHVAERPEQLGLQRPFYPQRSTKRGEVSQQQLLDGLGAPSVDHLRRRCELPTASRPRAASPLFWTMGAQQVGKAAIAGWRDVLAPALRAGSPHVALWPFDGDLDSLLRPGHVVVAESYPAEYYRRLGVALGPGTGSKRAQTDRRANARALAGRARKAGIKLAPELASAIDDGFGSGAGGEDRFDAVIGLFALVAVVSGHWPAGAPTGATVRRVEGGILGQSDAPLAARFQVR